MLYSVPPPLQGDLRQLYRELDPTEDADLSLEQTLFVRPIIIVVYTVTWTA